MKTINAEQGIGWFVPPSDQIANATDEEPPKELRYRMRKDLYDLGFDRTTESETEVDLVLTRKK